MPDASAKYRTDVSAKDSRLCATVTITCFCFCFVILHFVMNSNVLKILSDVCGVEMEYPPTETDLFYRMLLLLRFFAKTPSHLWYACQRDKTIGPFCPSCYHLRTNSIVQSHSSTCILLPLCLITNPNDKSRVKTYLKTAMNSSLSREVEEIGFDACHMFMAHMAQYPNGYRQGEDLLRDVTIVRKKKIPKWCMTYLIQWVMAEPPPPPTNGMSSIMVSEGSPLFPPRSQI